MHLLHLILCYANALNEAGLKSFVTFGEALDSYGDAITDTTLSGMSDATADCNAKLLLEWYTTSPVCRHHTIAELNNSLDQYYNGLTITEHTPTWEDAVDREEWPVALPVNATWGL